MKRYTCNFTTILQLLLHTILTVAAALPASIPLINAPVLHIANATLTSTSLAPLGTRVPFDYQGLTLVFTNFGKTIIPQAEVKDTLSGANKIVVEYLDIAPEEGIPQNRFEYRLPQGNVLLAIGGSPQRVITWRVLYRVLQALDRFMVTSRPPLGPHYQALNFEIQISGTGFLYGNGVIWYFPPGSDKVQKRTTMTPISTVSDASLLALNDSSSLTDDDILYPILGTSMTLHFYYIGLSLPPTLVKANLRGAIKDAQKFSFGPYENRTLREGYFRVVTSGTTSSVATTVFNSETHRISWRELFYILDGLREFVIGQRQSTTHFETLGCRIVDDKEGKIGIATLAYYNPPIPPRVERRAMADRKISPFIQIAKSTNQTMLSVIKDPIPVPVQWSIPDTNLTLIFKMFGVEVLLIELLSLLGAAQLRIASKVQSIPTEPIGSFRYQNGPGTLVLSFVTYDGQTITWLQLHKILTGLTLFCPEDHSRVAFFEIDVAEEGTTGFGVITNGPIAIPIQKRDSGRDYLSTSNLTSMSSENTNAILGARTPVYPIPGTPITLKIIFVGVTAISPVELTATLTSALRAIEPQVVAVGHQAIPGNEWMYEDRITKIAFKVNVYPGRTLLWQNLSLILIGIMHWMTAEGSSTCKILAFDVQIEGQGLVGDGFVLYDPSLVASGSSKRSITRVGESSELVEKMSSAPTDEITLSPSPATRQTMPTLCRLNPVVERDFDLVGCSRVQELLAHPTQLPQNLQARSVPSSNGTSLTLPIPYNIPHTNIVLRIQVLPTTIPGSRIASVFEVALQMLAQAVVDHPDDYFNEAFFFAELKYLEGRELIAIEVYPLVGERLTYLQLYSILVGMQLFINGDWGRPFRNSLTFKADIGGTYVAYGQLSYHFLRPSNTNTALTARSDPSSNGLNLDATIPYHIYNTNIDLQIEVLPDVIPDRRIIGIFHAARHILAQDVVEHPDEHFKENSFVAELSYRGGREVVAIYLYPLVEFTYRQLNSIINGLESFIEGAAGQPYRNANLFNVDIEGAQAACGLLMYIAPSANTTALTARSLSPPPPSATLTEPIPYPIIGTPITLAFTSLLPTPIPIQNVHKFFYYAFDKFEKQMIQRGGGQFREYYWNYHQIFPPNFNMSLTIFRKYGKNMSWKNLGEILDGLDDFMRGRWRPGPSLQTLKFDIEILEWGVVGRGELLYEARRVGGGGLAGVVEIGNDTSTS